MSDVLIVSRSHDLRDGTGGLRTISLEKFLENAKVSVRVVHSPPQRRMGLFHWMIYSAWKVLTSKEHIVFLSVGAFWSLLSVSIACRVSGKALIVDLRDPWSHNIRTGYGVSNQSDGALRSLKVFVSRAIEKFAYRSCSYFLVCTSGMMKYYRNLFGDDNKLRLVLNGYDFLPRLPRSLGPTVRAVCLGKFIEYGAENAEKSLQKISQILGERLQSVTFVGYDTVPLRQLLSQVGLLDKADFIPFLPYPEMVARLQNYDCGILTLRDESMEFGTKIFDYIGAGIPVLDSFASHSEFRSFFKEFIYSGPSEKCSFENQISFSRDHQNKKILELTDQVRSNSTSR